MLEATDELELLSRQSNIRYRGMTQYKRKGHFVKNTLCCSLMVQWLSVTAAMPMVGGSTLALLLTFIYFFSLFFFRLDLGVTFRG